MAAAVAGIVLTVVLQVVARRPRSPRRDVPADQVDDDDRLVPSDPVGVGR
jgi:hypothetical protein